MTGRGLVEAARVRVRGLLGYDSVAYRTLAWAANFGATLASEGPRTAFLIERLRSARAPGPAVSVKFRRLLHPIALRPNTPDADTLVSNAVRLEYGQLALAPDAPHFIVDAGAYIGDTSAFFLSAYPKAAVVALEPNPASFAIAERNLAPYGSRVTLLRNALADAAGTLFLSGSETGATVGETGGVAVESVTVPDLLTMAPTGRITVLKLDIEGAEAALFRNDAARWLDKIEHIIVETHGPDCEAALRDALGAAGWSSRRHRNLHYCSAP